jgi:hypothetical protein
MELQRASGIQESDRQSLIMRQKQLARAAGGKSWETRTSGKKIEANLTSLDLINGRTTLVKPFTKRTVVRASASNCNLRLNRLNQFAHVPLALMTLSIKSLASTKCALMG